MTGTSLKIEASIEPQCLAFVYILDLRCCLPSPNNHCHVRVIGKMIKSLFQCFFARRVRKSQIRRSYFASLPVDIITDIFVRLPIKFVLICRCVCKHWNTFISNPNFAKLLFTYTPPAIMIRR
ncbi:hypothetical protein Ahy_B06g080420 [Arachis hypogaea]|uniref:F-box domain-containing protein n=1 Tax=Arachis hypogaea TaxID=3818 RepID=A0A444YHW5_ARAHY|nr:hypothetical protein Ahy_B06g080420 [Arachis hypogaea]